MKILAFGLVLFTGIGCRSDFDHSLEKNEKKKVEATSSNEEKADEPNYITEDDISDSIEKIKTNPPAKQTAEVKQDMNSQIAEAFTDGEGVSGAALSEEQAREMADLTMAVVTATENGNIVQIIGAANKLAAFSEQSKANFSANGAKGNYTTNGAKGNYTANGAKGYGLVDVAGVVDAVQDLVAAAIDLDVAGIVDAVQDLIAAILD